MREIRRRRSRPCSSWSRWQLMKLRTPHSVSIGEFKYCPVPPGIRPTPKMPTVRSTAVAERIVRAAVRWPAKPNEGDAVLAADGAGAPPSGDGNVRRRGVGVMGRRRQLVAAAQAATSESGNDLDRRVAGRSPFRWNPTRVESQRHPGSPCLRPSAIVRSSGPSSMVVAAVWRRSWTLRLGTEARATRRSKGFPDDRHAETCRLRLDFYRKSDRPPDHARVVATRRHRRPSSAFNRQWVASNGCPSATTRSRLGDQGRKGREGRISPLSRQLLRRCASGSR